MRQSGCTFKHFLILILKSFRPYKVNSAFCATSAAKLSQKLKLEQNGSVTFVRRTKSKAKKFLTFLYPFYSGSLTPLSERMRRLRAENYEKCKTLRSKTERERGGEAKSEDGKIRSTKSGSSL